MKQQFSFKLCVSANETQVYLYIIYQFAGIYCQKMK